MFIDIKEEVKTKILTSSLRMAPAASGATMEIKFAKQFVMPMRVPAKFGAMSMCTICKEEAIYGLIRCAITYIRQTLP